MKELDPAEADALIALLAVPDPPLPAGNLSGLELVRRFVDDSEIRPGRAAGIEVCSLYPLQAVALPPEAARGAGAADVFAHQLKQLGFRQRKRTGRFRHDKRLLGVRDECGERLRTWLRDNPDTVEDRALFDPRTRGNWN